MATKHQVTDSRGKVHTRISQDRVYSHAIVAHYPEHYDGRLWPAVDYVSWSSTRALAEARRSAYKRAATIEIIEAQRS